VIRSFGDKATEDVFNGNASKAARSIPQAIWPSAQRKLDALNAATAPRDLAVPRGNRLEELRGRRAGTWSIRINDQYRITFKFSGGDATDVLIEDYH
jgi:toxin HigB-1